MQVGTEAEKRELRALENFAMWTMLQPNGQTFDPDSLKQLVNEWITMATQKTGGQAKYSQKGIPWDKESVAIDMEQNLDRVKMGILCEAVALVLSGALDRVQFWRSVDDDGCPGRKTVDAVPWPCSELVLVTLADGSVGVALCEDNPAYGKYHWVICWGDRGQEVTHWMPLPCP